MFKFLRNKTGDLRDDQGGSVAIELILVVPLLFWAYIGLFVYFDAYRQQNVNIKASFTVSDMLSREFNPVDQNYIDELNNVLEWLTYGRQDTRLRVTVVVYDEANDEHDLIWSAGADSTVPLTESEMRLQLTPAIPIMPDGDTAIVVETWASYRPLWSVGLPATTQLDNVVVISPRFVPQLLFDDGTGGGATPDPDPTTVPTGTI